MSWPNIGEVRVEVGYGLNVWLEERQVMVGSTRFMEKSAIALPEAIQEIQQAAYEKGHSLVYVAIELRFAAPIELRPTIRPEARELVRQLQKKKMSPASYLVPLISQRNLARFLSSHYLLLGAEVVVSLSEKHGYLGCNGFHPLHPRYPCFLVFFCVCLAPTF